MNVEKKLESFSRIIFNEAESQREAILAEYEADYEKSLEEAKKEAAMRSEREISHEAESIKRNQNREIFQASDSAKKAAVELRNQLIENLFKDVEMDLRAYAGSAEYADALRSRVLARLCDYPDAVFHVVERDIKTIDDICPGRTGVIPDEAIGGFVMLLPERNAREDCTFLAGMENERAAFNKLPAFYEKVD